MSLEDKASIVLPKGFAGKAGTLECWNPNTDSLVGLSVVRATNAWRINEAGAWDVSSSNVPRRDFLNGGCGDLLVEPQRTNLFLNSATGATQSITVASGSAYSVSFSGTGSITFLGGHTGTLNGTGAAVTDRVSTTFTTLTTSVTCTISGTVEYVNFELGSYATSWIETSGAAVTRNADVISGTGLAALLGQSGGALYIEASPFNASDSGFIAFSDNSFNNRVVLGINGSRLRYQAVINSSGAEQTNMQPSSPKPSTGVYFKALLRYDVNDFSLHVNGSKIASDTSGSTFSGALNGLYFNNGAGAGTSYWAIRSLVAFNNAPTEAQANSLTS